MIKFSKSIKKIIIKIRLKINRKVISKGLLKLRKIYKNTIPANNSTIKYLKEITLLQFLHLLFNIKKETII